LAVAVGFTFPPTHDSAAVVVLDGKLVFAAEEERYTRHKRSKGEPPFRSLIAALEYLRNFGIDPQDVDAFATNWDPKLLPIAWRFGEFMWSLDSSVGRANLGGGRSRARNYLSWAMRGFNWVDIARLFLTKVYAKIGAPFPHDVKIVPVMHHLAHAASAYYFSGFHSSVVVTIDGQGERDSTVVWRVDNGEFENIGHTTKEDGSLGLLYELVSEKLGFDRFEGPGKVMGLAPYGSNDRLFASRFDGLVITNGRDSPYVFADAFRTKRKMRTNEVDEMYRRISDFLAGEVDLNWNHRKEISRPAANLAWQLQHFTEETVMATAKWAKEQTGERNISLAGGVALNAKANMELLYSKMYNDLFIFPAANDAGTAIGAAAYVYEHAIGGKMRNERLEDVYLGLGYGEEIVKKVVKDSKWNAEHIGGDVTEVAKLVSRGKVVAWYQGRAELGPRALGNRSIIADPTSKTTWKKVNEIKGREFWRPLAPSVLDKDRDVYFRDAVDHRFMVLMFEMTKEGTKRAPAVSHVDNTARPQTVTKNSNPRWYNLIKAFESTNGEGIIVNTSFNLAGEPLVETPKEALSSFAIGGFDAIYLEGWLIRKHS